MAFRNLSARILIPVLLATAICVAAKAADAKSQLLQASDAAAGQESGDGVAGDANTIAVITETEKPSAVYVFTLPAEWPVWLD